MNRKWIAGWLLSMATLLGISLWYIYTPGAAPEGQPKLVTLTPANIQTFQQEFNQHADKIRLVALFSPT